MNTNFELFTSLSVDISSVKKTMSKAQKDIGNATDKIEKSFDGINNSIGEAMTDATKEVKKSTSKIKNMFGKTTKDIQKDADGAENSTKKSFSKMASSAIKSIRKIGSNSGKEFDDVENDAKEAANGVEGAFSNMSTGIKGALAGLAGAFAISGISNWIDESKEVLRRNAKLEQSFANVNVSVKDGTKVYEKFVGLLGDADTATEATQLMMNLTDNVKDQSKWIDIASGAFSKYGDAMPIESLIEASAETAKTGELTGALSDALNWAGVNEEKFQAKLDKCNTEAEREKLLREELNKLYGDAGQKYQENNKALSESEIAQERFNTKMAELAEGLMPIKTDIMNFVSDVIGSFDFTVLQEKWDMLKAKLSEIDWNAILTDLKDIGGYISETLTGVFDGLKTNLSKISGEFGLFTDEKDAGKGLKILKSFFEWTSEHSQEIADGITIIGGAIATANLANKIIGIGKAVVKAFDMIKAALAANPLTLFIALLAGAVIAILLFQEEIEKWGTEFQNTLQEKIGDPMGEAFDDWYGKYFKGALDDCGRFFRGETEWQKKCSEVLDDLKESWKEFKNGLGDTFAGEAIRWIGNIFINFLNTPMDTVKGFINGIVDGFNWLLDLVDSPDRLPKIPEDFCKIPALAKGTNNWQGGTAIVGEAGQEIVNLPNGKSFVTQGATLMNLPKHAQVIPNSITKHLLDGGIRGFADGLNVGSWFKNIFEYVMNPSDAVKDLIKGVTGSVDTSGKGSIFKNAIKGWIENKLFDFADLGGWFTKKFKEFFSWDGFIGGKAEDYADMIKSAASFFGEKLTNNELARVIQQINTESGGDPTAVQSMAVWDINAQTGNLARGLLQYVPSTFKGYAVPGYTDIWNPYHQLLAFFNNSTWREALPELGEKRGWTPRGGRKMADGGIVKGNSNVFANIGEEGHDEYVIPLTSTGVKPLANSLLREMENNGEIGNQSITVHVTVPLDGKVIAEETIHISNKLEQRSNRRNGKR